MTDVSASGSDAAGDDAETSPFAPPPAGVAPSPFAPPTPAALVVPSPTHAPPPDGLPTPELLAAYPPPPVPGLATAVPGYAAPGYAAPGYAAPGYPVSGYGPPASSGPPPVAPLEGRRPPLWLALGLIAVLLLPAVLHWALRQSDLVLAEVLTGSVMVREIVLGVVLLVIMVAARYSRTVGWVPRPGAGAAVRLIAAGLVVTAFVAGTAAAVELALTTSELLIVLVNVVAVAVVEETLFRGYLWAALPASWSTSRVLLVTSLVFGSVHVLNGLVTGRWGAAVAQAAAACVLGLALGATRMRSGWLGLGVAVHAAIDGAAVVIGMLAPRFQDTQHPLLGPVLPLLAYFSLYVTFAVTGIVVLVRTFRSERRARRAAAPAAHAAVG